MTIPRRITIGAALAVVLAGYLAGPAAAHTNGRVQLWVDHLALQSGGGDQWTLSVTLVDADSGTPQPGFDVAVGGSDDAGHTLPTVALSDAGGGRYTAELTADPGRWSLLVRADTRPGGVAGVPLRRSYPVVLEPGKDVTIGSASPARVGAGSAPLPQLNIQIERAEREGRTPLWLPVRVTVTEGDANAPFGADHIVFAAARNARDDDAGPFELGNLELEGRPGVHEGFVIVPYGGTWTITATVNDAHADSGTALLGRTSADLVVDAPIPAEGAAAVSSTSGEGPASEPLEVAVLWAHTMVAILWGLAATLLVLLALPAGRRFLSEYGTTLLDGRLDKIARAAWWLTGLVVATGIYNLVNSVAYRVPLSPDQASRLFRLPYAQPYYLSLAAKLLAYAVMIGLTIPLIREARRRAATAGAGPGAAPAVILDDDPSPWENPQRRLEGDQVSGGGRVALRRRTAVATDVAVEADSTPTDQDGRSARGLVAVMLTGGAVIITAVTLLKYFHLLGEVSRLSG